MNAWRHILSWDLERYNPTRGLKEGDRVALLSDLTYVDFQNIGFDEGFEHDLAAEAQNGNGFLVVEIDNERYKGFDHTGGEFKGNVNCYIEGEDFGVNCYFPLSHWDWYLQKVV